MSEDRVETGVPWYELDRMIIVATNSEDWEFTMHVITRVMRQCMERSLTITEVEIVWRILALVKLGTLGLTGDIWQWREPHSGVCLMIYD